jgi:hypothetical protein
MTRGKLIYILAPSFSGSTLLTFFLDKHEQIRTFGELKATSMGPIDRYYCSCGELIEKCAFWSELKARCDERGVPFDLADFGTHFTSRNPVWAKILGAQVRGPLFEGVRRLLLDFAPGLHGEYRRIMRQNAKIMELILGGADDWYLDGSKDPSRLMYFAREGRWRIKVIKMTRDGRGQSNSHRKRYAAPFEEAVRDWDSTIRQMNRVAGMLPAGDVMDLTYEALCRDPSGTMSAVWRFLQLAPPAIDWTQKIDKGVSHILGNDQMRQSPIIEIRLDERWRNDLTADEHAMFDAIAGSTNRSLGYS